MPLITPIIPAHGTSFNPSPLGTVAQGDSNALGIAADYKHVHATTPAVDLTTDFGSVALRWATYFGGILRMFPGASVTPATNGEVTFELTNNTTLTFKAKGSDATVRSGTITLT